MFPFDFMEVGDSFFVPTLKPAYMTAIIDERAKTVKLRVKIYPDLKDNCLGVRVWRVS